MRHPYFGPVFTQADGSLHWMILCNNMSLSRCECCLPKSLAIVTPSDIRS